MFNLEIPISSYILLGIEIILGLLLLLFLIRPLRLIKRLPLNPYEEMNERKNVISEKSDIEEQPEIAEPEQSDITGAELSSSMETEKKYPKVSVVVYSTVNEEVLTEFLRQITSQDYPDFEVIVVCDATQETSSMLSEKFAAIFPNVYITFIPPGSHNLSRRKLAISLGVK
ncbi:MAG: glycosyltransferase family 2 protein, partial [Muribaculaceae bacterium]|nr:glycosyltransferase family 2 protein [Muribaculaceae bacterium]